MPKKKAPSAAAKQRELEKRYAKLVAGVWADEEFRERLFSDPATVLKEAGFKVQEGRPVKVIELDMEEDFYFVLPKKPRGPFTDTSIESVITKSRVSVFYTGHGFCFLK